MEQVALLGDVRRDVGRIGDRVFVADDGAEFRDQFRRQRRHGGLNDIHCFSFTPAPRLRGAAGR